MLDYSIHANQFKDRSEVLKQQETETVENTMNNISEPTSFCNLEMFKNDIIKPGGIVAEKNLSFWMQRAQKTEWVDIGTFVSNHDHKTLYQLTLDDINRVTKDRDPSIRTGHAIGNIHRGEVGVSRTEKFSTPWALVYLFHGLMERKGTLPRWEDFDNFLRGAARKRYYEPFMKAFDYPNQTEQSIVELERGFHYRAGNAYYSFLREIDLFTRLRIIYGLDVRYHLLADTQFKIDLWVKNVLVSLFIGNPTYRKGSLGRKSRVCEKLNIDNFHLLELDLKTGKSSSGYPLLASENEIIRAVDMIKKYTNC